MNGHCNTKGHTDKPHRKRQSCRDWQGVHANEPIDYSKIEVESDEESVQVEPVKGEEYA